MFVGMSAHVTVYGLGDAITSEHDTGDSKIKVPLPLGKYVWIAQPPAGHYVVGATTGQIDATDACKVAAPTATVTQESTLLPVTGDGDISVAVAIAIGVGLLGLLAMVVGGSRLLKK